MMVVVLLCEKRWFARGKMRRSDEREGKCGTWVKPSKRIRALSEWEQKRSVAAGV